VVRAIRTLLELSGAQVNRQRVSRATKRCRCAAGTRPEPIPAYGNCLTRTASVSDGATHAGSASGMSTRPITTVKSPPSRACCAVQKRRPPHKYCLPHHINVSRILNPLMYLLACATRQELARQVHFLKTENEILRSRLPKTIRTTQDERRRLIKAARSLGRDVLQQLASIVRVPMSNAPFRNSIVEGSPRRFAHPDGGRSTFNSATLSLCNSFRTTTATAAAGRRCRTFRGWSGSRH
jgi:hypothetical protein